MKPTTKAFAALAAGALVWGSAQAAQAAPTATEHAAVEAAQRGAAAREAGFGVVRAAAAEVVALHSPRAGELWVVERGGPDEILLEHLRDGRWTTTRLAGQLPYDGTRQVIDGSAANDIWLAAGDRIYRYDGRRWNAVTPPRVSSGAPLQAVVAADVPGPGAYVATFDEGVFRYDGRRWASLGKPKPSSPQGTPGSSAPGSGAHYWPRFMEVRDGVPYVLFERFDRRAYLELHRYGRSWAKLADGLGSRGPHVSEEPRAWLLEKGPKVTVLGYLNAPPGVVGGTCFTWRQGGATGSCLTAESVSAGAERADGTLILGGRSSVGGTSLEPTALPARFATRDRAGVEKVVPGNPGDETIALAVEPRTGVTWAATRTGESYSLQRWSGVAPR